MTTADAILALSLPPLMAASAFCNAAETALFSLTHADRARLKKGGRGTARAVAELLDRPRTLLVSLLLLNNAANITFFVIASILSARFESPWAHLGLEAASLVGLIVFCEVLPKIAARQKRIAFCRLFTPAIVFAVRAIAPLRAFFEIAFIAPLTRLIRPARPGPPPAVSPEELGALLDISARGGEIDAGEQRLLAEVIELSAIRVRDAMTPRVDLRWVEDPPTRDQVLEAASAMGRDEVPLCREGLDGTVLGMLDARAYLASSAARDPAGEPRAADAVRPAIYLPERSRLDQVLAEFRRSHRRTALCVDEYGAIVGFITLDHILRRLLASLAAGAEGPDARVTRVGPDSWLVPGRLPIRDLADFLAGPGARSARHMAVSTAAGLVLLTLGRLPVVGDEVRAGNLRLRVESVRGRTIESILVTLAPGAGAEYAHRQGAAR